MMGKLKLIYYVNQFFGHIGGEDNSYQEPIIKVDNVVGPGKELERLAGDEANIIATIICGDTYFAENQDEAIDRIINMINGLEFDVFIAGPAFNAGRYGLACGAVCKAIQEKFGVSVVTSMYKENPGAEIYSKDVYILNGGSSAAFMRQDLSKLTDFAVKLGMKEYIGFPEEEGYMPQGIRTNVFREKTGAIRGIDMLLKKLKNEDFVTELPMPIFDKVEPAPAVGEIENAIIALITSGGVVPKGNPDHIEAANATKFGKYSIENINDLVKDEFITVHGGYDPVYVLEDPDRVLPVDVMRLIEKEGKIGKLFNFIYSTVGNTTAVTSAERFGRQIGEDLLKNGVSGAILTST